jgi:hypothetical protein
VRKYQRACKHQSKQRGSLRAYRSTTCWQGPADCSIICILRLLWGLQHHAG